MDNFAPSLPYRFNAVLSKIDFLHYEIKLHLESLLSIEATKSLNCSKIQNLLENPLFANAIGSLLVKKTSVIRPYLKFYIAAKEALATFKIACENRRKEDFKKTKMLKKKRKRHEILTDDSRRKRRQLKDQVNLN